MFLLNERTTMHSLDSGSEGAFWGLLLHCGFLTVVKAKPLTTTDYHCQLRAPNHEVIGAFAFNIQFAQVELFDGGSNIRFDHFLRHLLNGEFNEFANDLAYYLLHVPSHFDFRKKPPETHF